jgi:hypothetical protein
MLLVAGCGAGQAGQIAPRRDHAARSSPSPDSTDRAVDENPNGELLAPDEPAAHLGVERTAGECPACFGVRDLPALSPDGQRIAAIAVVPTYYEESAAWIEADGFDFVLLDASDGRVLDRVALLTHEDLQPDPETFTDCCEPGEENCDPHLCEPDDEMSEAAGAEARRRTRERLARAHALLGPSRWRPLRELSGEHDLSCSTSRSSTGAQQARVVVAREGTSVVDDTLAVCAACEHAEVAAWTGPERLLLIRVTVTNTEQSQSEVHWLVRRLDAP